MSAELESRDRRWAELRRRVDAMSARVENAARLTSLLRQQLTSLHVCLREFVRADVRATMRQLTNDIHDNRRRLQYMTTVANNNCSLDYDAVSPS